MLYEYEEVRVQREKKHVVADSPEEAYRIAKQTCAEGFRLCDTFTEVEKDGDGEFVSGADHEVLSICESCDKPLFDDPWQIVHGEDCDLCQACAKALEGSQP